MEEELKVEQVLDKVLDAVLLVDRDAKIVYANPAVRLFGYSQSDLIGKRILDFVPKKYQEQVLELIKSYIEGKMEFSRVEIEIPEKNGELRWTDVVISKIDDFRAVMQMRDITDLKKIMRELEESRETYKTIFEAYPDFMSVLDSEGKILSVNKNFLKRYGLEEKKIIGSPIISFVHPEELDKALNLLKKALDHKNIVRDTLRVIVAGEKLIVDISMRFLKIGDKVFGIIVGKDITEKAKLEEEIKRREELYRNIIDSNIAGFLLVENSKILFANKTVTKITGYSEEEILNKPVEVFFEEEDKENFRRVVNDILKGKEIEIISRFRRKDGNRGYARILANLMEYKGRKLILVSFEDITEKREIERKLEERNILYKTLVESSHTGIFIIQNNKIVYANEVIGRILGYTIEEINNLPHPYIIVAPEFRNIAMERYRAREKGLEVPDSYEVKIITKEGKERWLSVLAKGIKYKGAPAVMVNVADITKLKENEEALKRMNALLRVAGEIKGMLIQENSELGVFSNLKSSLEKLNADVGVYFVEKNFIRAAISLKHPYLDFLSDKINIKEVTQELVGDNWLTFIPILNDGLHSIVVISRKDKFSEEELRVISTISQDVSMRLRALKVEKEKEKALKLIMENLEHFEELADKLRNPLAVIKGYLEIRDEVPEKDFIRNISEHADRIEKILDELRFKEFATYQMKKVLETRAE
ncbi:MAG: PAS domain S-box protein [Archaeoglobaceae archaeon]|nr:PAS domain S-box protein [Archaeoglobaceae archaeon]MDW8118612.1 PAS domain S-box protein [Archaeoglobaceae archaeon]